MSKTILLVDDDPEFRAELKEALYEYTVVEASSGQLALSMLKKPNEIDLVLLDVKLPGGSSGTDILRDIKKLSTNLKIIILTGYSSKDIAIEALKGRADDYLEKPLDIAHTKEIIEKLLGGRPGLHDDEALHLRDKSEKVKRFIERNYDKKAGLNEAALVACLSPKYLSRVFKESLELLPYQKTASSMTPSLAAQKIVNLVKNIYTATCRLRPPESATARANLFLSVHNSANRGFIDARDTLEAENAFSKDIERTYVHTQWLSHQALNNYLGFINSGKELPEAELTGMEGASPDQRPRSAGNDGARPLVKNDSAAPPPQQHLKPLGNSGIWNRFNSIISYSRQKYSRH